MLPALVWAARVTAAAASQCKSPCSNHTVEDLSRSSGLTSWPAAIGGHDRDVMVGQRSPPLSPRNCVRHDSC